ncbi:MAG: GNAT family N-acetyltransferase [Clostridia bacterium]|nr:GNAT family N-acetyltransferase [Clostridia bacterium]
MARTEIRKIRTAGEWKNMYRLYKEAFPRAERKPFLIFLSTWRKGKTDVWYAEETIHTKSGTRKRFLGFATTLNGENDILLDYLAVKKSARCRGIGSRILKTLVSAYIGKGFFVEIESVYENGARNLSERMRRRNFYVKNGLHALNVVADVSGIQMELLGRDMVMDFQGYNDFYKHNYSAFAAKNVTRINPPEKYL